MSIPHRLLAFPLIFALIIASSCRKSGGTGLDLIPTAAYAPYVAAFTSGLTSAHDPIQVQFAANVEGAEPGAVLTERVLVFKPKIEGELRWANRSTLVFHPSEPLPQHQAYAATLHLAKLLPSVPDSLAYMRFGFQTLAQGLAVDGAQLQPDAASAGERARLQLAGTIRSFDRADAALVEATVSAQQDGRALPVSWQHEPDQRRHRFTVSGILRERGGSDPVTLRWTGSPLGLAFDSTRTLQVPALDSFVVTSVTLLQDADQQVEIAFSDPVDPTQDLRGLVGVRVDADASVRVRGNIVVVQPSQRIAGEEEVFVTNGVRSVYGDVLRADFRQNLAFRDLVPAVELIGDGVIVPSVRGTILPFKAVALAAVNVTVTQIFSNNVDQFFQDNDLGTALALRRVGRQVFTGEIPLRADDAVDLLAWNNYALDLAKLVAVDPGAIYRVAIDFAQTQSRYPCGAAGASASPPIAAGPTSLPYEIRYANYEEETNYYYDPYYEEGYYGEDYDDGTGTKPSPCEPDFYQRRGVTRNFLASDIGLIAKRSGNGELLVIATDLKTAAPIGGLDVELHNYQQQVTASAKTGGNGVAVFAQADEAFLVVAKRDRERGYLRLAPTERLSTSTFDVAGESTVNGARGFLYAERGVWRPGDSIYVTLAVDESVDPALLGLDRNVRFDFFDPEGRSLYQRILAPSAPGFYDFRIATAPDAPTGVYSVVANYHGSQSELAIRVETVMPNRLKVAFELAGEPFPVRDNTQIGIQARWLTGLDAGALKADVELSARPTAPVFAKASETAKYSGYHFLDESRDLSLSRQVVFDGNLSEEGRARFALPLGDPATQAAPGMLRATFVTRVFEPTGPFSTVTKSIVLSPYATYLGVRIPDDKNYWGFDAAEPIPIQLVALTEQGTPAASREIDVEVYNVDWSFWWERGGDYDLANFVANRGTYLAYETTVRIDGGRATWNANLAKLPYGRKLLRFVDRQGGHATSALITLQDPRWAYDPSSRPGGAEILAFNLDRGDYEVGQTAKVALPAFAGGRALVSVERGDRVLRYQWVEGREQPQDLELEVTADMVPNAYVSVHLIQPHAQTVNDQPIRMYGVQALNVTSAKTRLKPEIALRGRSDPRGKELAPEEPFTVSVSEADGRAMSYTLDVVEEGLLDLTSYQTPDPYRRFHERLALGVVTYDLYRHVLGAFDGKLAGILGVGGDATAGEKVDPRANRFRPVVKHLGPFYLAPGATAKHELRMPNYVGSVRVMVVAGQGGAFGSAEETRPVRRPLMVLATLPRVVSPGEVIEMPVTVFATDPSIRRVELTLDGVELLEPETRTGSVSFASTGEQVTRFRLRVPDRLGVARIKVKARGANFTASDAIELQVRAPNPPTTQVVSAVVEPGETWSGRYVAVGVDGTNTGSLEVSGSLPLNLESRLRYLTTYPYGCLEQTISQAFPQLYLADLTDLSPERARTTQQNVEATLARLPSYRRGDGSFSYWPGEGYLSNWSTNYAGHFLIAAEAKGYRIPADLRSGWLGYQRRAANAWTPEMARDRPDDSEYIQAYRLLTLALAKEPQFGAMNRLKAGGPLRLQTLQMLAASYALAGQTAVAQEVLAKAPAAAPVDRDAAYREYTFGAPLRDEAVELYVYTLLNARDKAFRVAQSVSRQIASEQWYSTQTTAWSLLALSVFQDGERPGEPLTYSYALGTSNPQAVKDQADLRLSPLPRPTAVGQSLKLTNTGKRRLYVRIVTTGISATSSKAPEINAGIRMSIAYADARSGQPVDVSALPQGSDIRAVVTITNTSGATRLSHLALTQMFPAGWEIRNRRLEGTAEGSAIEYQDIRDDRVLSFFDLAPASSVTVRTDLNAAYVGDYYLPQVYAEAMYDNDIRARSSGRAVRVLRADAGPQ